MFCQQCHPSVVPDDAEIQLRNASQIHTYDLFPSQFCLYLHFGDPEITSIGQNSQNVVLNSHANFGEKLWKALTACHGPGGALGQVS